MTKSGTEMWDLGREDLGTPRCGTRRCRDVGRGIRGCGDVELGMWDVGAQGGDKQTTPDFCAQW